MPPASFTHKFAEHQYFIHPQHRNGNPNKSQWTITPNNEFESFKHAANSNWLTSCVGWGVFPITGAPDYLGVATDRITRLVIAKFVPYQETLWHGYPANHIEKEQDIPDEFILKKWIDEAVLPKAKISKISKGKPCNL